VVILKRSNLHGMVSYSCQVTTSLLAQSNAAYAAGQKQLTLLAPSSLHYWHRATYTSG